MRIAFSESGSGPGKWRSEQLLLAQVTAEDVRDLMVATVEHRFGQVNTLPHTIGAWEGNLAGVAQAPEKLVDDLGSFQVAHQRCTALGRLRRSLAVRLL